MYLKPDAFKFNYKITMSFRQVYPSNKLLRNRANSEKLFSNFGDTSPDLQYSRK